MTRPCKFPGLYGEVVTEDCYQLRTLPFTPDVFIDVGANIGITTRFALELWPQVRVIAVEPDAMNILDLEQDTDLSRVTLVRAAMGPGPFYYNPTAINGAHKAFLSDGVGHPAGTLARHPKFAPIGVQGTNLAALVERYTQPGQMVVVKLDCEGGENTIWVHPPSVEALSRADYLAMELHNSAATETDLAEINAIRQVALDGLKATHETEQGRIYFRALRKGMRRADSVSAGPLETV